MMKKTITSSAISVVLLSAVLGLSACSEPTLSEKMTADAEKYNLSATYSEDWQDLAKVNEDPKWFQDAKLGIYTHWGPVSEANVGLKWGAGWYGLYLYMDKAYDWKTGEIKTKPDAPDGFPSGVFKNHSELHGHPSEFGYKDIIKKFNPSGFDAKEWAELFKKAGAKFAGPVAMHHDNFAMWDSDVTRWNISDMHGIDITGELKKEIESQDMKFLTSFHHAFTWVYYANAHNFDATEETSDLYTDKHDLLDFKPTKRFHDRWFATLKEVIDKYQPEVLWFDWWVEELDEDYRKRLIAYYYNKGKEWGKDVVISYKNTSFPAEVGVHDYERGRPKELKDKFWMTDTSPGAWFYRQNAKFVSSNEIVDILIDIVSKNGLMLLNVPPDPDGSIPTEMQTLLLDLGKWLEVNGEAIYETRPWRVFGEGPTRIRGGGHKVEKQKIVYTDKDIRFTRKGEDTLYAIVMDKPGSDIVIKTLSSDLSVLKGQVKSIQLLGSEEKVDWQLTAAGLEIKKPHSVPSDLAISYKINLAHEKEWGIGGEDDPGN